MLEAVRAESARHNANVLALGVKVGQLSGAGSKSLRLCFDGCHRGRRCAQDFAAREYRPMEFAYGFQAHQITSGGACHPETRMVAAALAEPDAEIVEVSYTTGVGLDTRRQWIDARVGEC